MEKDLFHGKRTMSDLPGTEAGAQSRSFDAARDRLVNTALMLFLAFSVPLLATSLYRAAHVGWQPLMYFHIGLTLAAWLIALFRAFSEAHIASMQLLAEVLSEGFGRMEDLRRLESRSRKLARIRRELEQRVAEQNAELVAMQRAFRFGREAG